jgi:hypothetical protein
MCSNKTHSKNRIEQDSICPISFMGIIFTFVLQYAVRYDQENR